MHVFTSSDLTVCINLLSDVFIISTKCTLHCPHRSQYSNCELDARRRLKNFHDDDVRLESLDRDTRDKLLQPLINLRQACCHPQAVRGKAVIYDMSLACCHPQAVRGMTMLTLR